MFPNIHINGFCLNQIDHVDNCFIHDFVNLDLKWL